MNLFTERWEKARALMEKAGISALLVTPSTDLTYMTGYAARSFERIVCFVLTQTKIWMLVPKLELNNLSADLTNTVECIAWNDGQDPLDILAKLPGITGRIAVGQRICGMWLLGLQKRLAGAQWVNGDVILSVLRRVKDVQEIEYIRTAQHKAESALKKLYRIGLEGKSERQIGQILTQLRADEGLTQLGPGMIACSENAASPHHTNSDRVVQVGDSVMMDFSGSYHGYNADMTRTCVVGYPPEGFVEVYNIVLKAHLATASAIRPGVTCQSIDRTARQIINDAGYGPYFTHRVGHGIGLDLHEEPYMVEGNQELLVPGNVFSDEPGIYLPERYGIRIENLMVVTNEGSESLNEMSLELQIVK